MRSITEVELTNYKTHEHTHIVLQKLTAFVGLSEAGKSNILKGMQMVLLNEAFPDTHVRRGTAKNATASVRIKFSDGSWISRSRTGNKQELVMQYADGHKEVNATIRDCDDLVAEFTGFRRVSLDGKSKGECVQSVPLSEATAPFLIAGNTPAVVLRKINMLVAGARIEQAQMLLASAIRKRTTDIDASNVLIAAVQEELAALDDARYNKLAELHDSAKDMLDTYNTAQELKEDLVYAQELTLVAEECTKTAELYDRLFQNFETHKEEADALKRRLADAQKLRANLQNAAQRVRESDLVDTDAIHATIADIEQQHASLEDRKRVSPCGKCNKLTMEVTI